MKTTNLLLISLALLAATGCKKNNNNEENAPQKDAAAKETLFADFSCQMKTVTGGPVTESWGPNNKLWTNGRTIKVRFISGEGTAFVRGKVQQYAKSWESSANLTFQFVADNAAADLTVGFKHNGDAGSWAYVGIDGRGQSQSVNFGWFDNNTSDEEFRRTTTHEFGHVLGLQHEQAHPDANIPWNKDAVYAYYEGSPNFWSKDQIDFNVLWVGPRTGSNLLTYDKLSIMHYPVPARFTTNNVAIAANNTTITATDAAYMKKYYPGR
jgi:serralysin